MDIRRQIALVWRSKWLILAAAVLAGGLSYYVTSLQPKTYEATATAIVGQSLNAVGLDINALEASQRLSATYATIATTRPLLDRVIAKEGLNTTADLLAQHVFAEAPLNSSLINVTVSDTSPDRAALIANDIVDELVSASPAIQGRESGTQKFIDDEFTATQQEITGVRAQIDALAAEPSAGLADDARLQQLRNNLASLLSSYSNLLSYSSSTAANGLSVIQPAIPPIDSAGPRILVNTLLGLMAGLIAVIAFVFIRDYLDDTIKRGDQVEEALGIATLGTITRLRGRGGRPAYHLVTRDDSPFARRGGIRHAEHEHRFRPLGRPGSDPSGHEFAGRRREIYDCCEFGDRVRAVRPTDASGRRGSTQAGYSSPVRPRQFTRTYDPCAI